MAIFKIEAEGDTVYVDAESRYAAREYLFQKTGEIPDDLLTFTEVDAIPEGEELL